MTAPVIRSHDEALRFLLEFVDYEKVTKYKYDVRTFNLGRVEELMAAVGHPERAFRSIHIAGTKGKGSTAAMAQSILTAAGFRTGLYTSPHLSRIEERMTVDGELMPEEEFVQLVNELAPYTLRQREERPNESPTYFELVTAAGFRHFARRRVELAVVEVGMGGRLDATNVIRPEVSVITRVDYDHEERLGHTLDRIAFEKAGIIKPGVPVVCAPQEPEALSVVAEAAERRGSPWVRIGSDYRVENVRTGLDARKAPFCRFDLCGRGGPYRGLELRMLGEHQATNAACAVAAVELLAERLELKVVPEAVRRGLASARSPARLEVFPGEPLVLLDGAHNPISMRALCAALDGAFAGVRLVLLMGVSRDKNVEEILKLILPRAAAAVFTRSDSPRAMAPLALAERARDIGVRAEICEDPHQALARARELARPEDLLCITGSFFLAGMLRPSLAAGQTPAPPAGKPAQGGPR
jgi:dihydrofolate synthase/folylpolyglutamate synthase